MEVGCGSSAGGGTTHYLTLIRGHPARKMVGKEDSD